MMALEAEPFEMIGVLLKGAAMAAAPTPVHKIVFRKWVLNIDHILQHFELECPYLQIWLK